MAALLIDGRSFCGGSIISKRHILTAVSLQAIFALNASVLLLEINAHEKMPSFILGALY